MRKVHKFPYYCKYCGAKLKRDVVGLFCPTQNCQWRYGLPESEDRTQSNKPNKADTLNDDADREMVGDDAFFFDSNIGNK